jgi:hypothetical protein
VGAAYQYRCEKWGKTFERIESMGVIGGRAGDRRGRIDFNKYEGLQPVYSEYSISPFRRSFRISSQIDQDKIKAEMHDGVITLTLSKAEGPSHVASR